MNEGGSGARYELLETLLADGERVEERARDRTLGREVLLVRRRRPAAEVEAGGQERALREARALAGLVHPGVQRLYDVFEQDGEVTLVLEPVGGETLAGRLEAQGPLAPGEVRELAISLAEALAAVHAAGAVHRDVSEANVLLRPEGGVCLSGFRLAKPVAQGAQTSLDYQRRSAPGRAEPAHAALPTHPAPEQLGGEAASPRSDLFALGCVLYRALTGEPAQPGLLEQGWRAPVDPSRLRPQVPRSLSRLVTACLARSPLGRPRSAAELAAALRALGGAPPAGEGRAARARLAASVAGGLVLALGAGAWLLRPAAPAAGTPLERGIGLEPAAARSSQGTFGASFHRSHALLIGIGTSYRRGGFAPLPNAARDVEALRETLAGLDRDNWETRVLLEEQASSEGIRAALVELEAALEREDRVLIYFAGHGVPHPSSGTSGWLIPADAQVLERDPSRARWLHFDVFERFLKDAQAKHVLLAMDCCYGGRLATARSAAPGAYETRFLTRPARVVLAAGRADEPVLDGVAQGHSPFAEVFLEALRAPRDAITSSMLHSTLLRAFAERDVPHTPVLAFLPEVGPGEFVFLAN